MLFLAIIQSSCLVVTQPKSAGVDYRWIKGTVDIDPEFRYQFLVSKGEMFIRRKVHPGGDKWRYWIAPSSPDVFRQLQHIAKLSGSPKPYPPPGPIASFSGSDSLSFSNETLHDYSSLEGSKSVLIDILKDRCAPGHEVKKLPLDIQYVMEP